ncbi:hypothetical protein HID58_080689 [Brassica napus]|uniref:Uncharacterized protein n=1 Tax=Brassica napus TaxID=3708 RepID=A0ABQ7Y5L3_BRANA|nr:hypothetical protein HID58_080689 [Brassica napus]
MELFRFMAYSQILEFTNTGKQLPDAIGELNATRSTITDRLPGAQHVMLTLRLRSGENVCVSMFDSLALAFHTKLDSYGREPRVVIATSVNPKVVGAMTKVTNVRAVEVPHPMGQGEEKDLRNPSKKVRTYEGSLYTLTGFGVVRSNNNFRLSDASFSIRFNEGTSLEKVTASARPILMELFRFMAYSQILEFTNTGKQLPDVIGELNAIRSTITDRLPGAHRVMLTLRLRSGENVCVSMFDSLALAFHTKLDSYGREPRVVIATRVNHKIVEGRLFLNGTSSTHLYFDSETAAGKEVFDMYDS